MIQGLPIFKVFYSIPEYCNCKVNWYIVYLYNVIVFRIISFPALVFVYVPLVTFWMGNVQFYNRHTALSTSFPSKKIQNERAYC